MSAFIDHPNIQQADKRDILELENRIQGFKTGKEDEERFKLYRLTRGVYGQRQLGGQMFRIKIPYGKITPAQFEAIADTADKYASSNLHLTTRQDIQLHYVKLENSPHVWRDLTNNGLTGREACGNTVRNLTASPTAGIDPYEPFDITPYAHATAYYFLRNPICQEMGRKIKPCFSSSDLDTAYTYFHDFGFIPKLKDGIKGFKVLVGGGLGAIAITAPVAYEFLAANKIIPFMEASLRVFDRYGERSKRQKARMKFLVKKLGIDAFLELVNEEWKSLSNQVIEIDDVSYKQDEAVEYFNPTVTTPLNKDKFELWKKTNTFEQKQDGFVGVYIKILLGDISSETARLFAKIARKYASDDVRITVNQGLLLRFVHQDHLVELFTALEKIGFADPGFDSIADVTACPGTDTCNLGVTNSTKMSEVIEDMLKEEYPELLEEKHIKIKISGCMNACGQHMVANIGFHGSSIKKNNLVIPAVQVVLGGGTDPTGKGWIAEKVIKVPTKKALDVIRNLLDDYEENASHGEYYNYYYERQGKKYFYTLLKPLAEIETLTGTDLFDWGQDHKYKQEIGVGECAGVILDVVGTIIKDALNRLDGAAEEFENNHLAESCYYSYSSFVIGAKAMLLSDDIKCNTQIGIIKDFEEHFIATGKFEFDGDFTDLVLGIKKNIPTKAFAEKYMNDAKAFLEKVIKYREQIISNGQEDKKVIESYYKA